MGNKRFVTPDDVETQVFDWGMLKWMSEPDVTNAERFSMGVVILEPGKGHTSHNHPGTEEILYVISGTGEQQVAGERRQIGPGMLIHIPPDVYHETINTGWEQMKLVAIYSPPGPEKELANLPGCKIVPAGQIATR
ncbi:MAG: cupin domain-containing protein [Anaerolineae bacterium]|nr:cupin domain-containing protein [Anaerolineae bacterium]